MSAIYVDSSAILRSQLEETGQDDARAILRSADLHIGSRLVVVEVATGLAAAIRASRITPDRTADVQASTLELLAALRAVELTRGIADHAASLGAQHALTGADAIHLASALAVGGDLVFTTWDRRLHRAARAVGLRVAPAALD